MDNNKNESNNIQFIVPKLFNNPLINMEFN